MIESTVAIFVLSIGILAILTMFPLGIKVIGSSKTNAVGIQLVQEKIEEIISLSYENISVGESVENQLPPPFSSYSRETRITYIDPALNLQETDDDKGAKKIEVTVYWNSSLLSGEVVGFSTIISEK